MSEDHGDIHLRLSAQDEILREQTKALSSIDTNVALLRKDLIGNGQPGRLPVLETAVKNLEAKQNRAEGFWKGVNWLKAGIVVAAVEAAKYFWHGKQ